jgi:DNA-binding LytR/AlgR family response regulator
MLKAIIVDDDLLSRKAIEKCIERTDGIEILAQFDSAVECEKQIDNYNCDVIFLDIEMSEMSGIEFMDTLKNIPQIVIISSKPDYAAEAFNYDVSDYIVKPIEYNRFLKAFSKVTTINDEVTKNNTSKDHLFFKKNNALIKVEFTDINYVEAYADYVSIHTDGQKIVVLSTMKAIEQRFPKNDFMRVHRSFIIRLDKIKSIEDSAVCISSKTIPVSRSYKSDFMNKMNIF